MFKVCVGAVGIGVVAACDGGDARLGVGVGDGADHTGTVSSSLAGPVRAGEGRARAVDQTDQRVGNAGPRACGTGDKFVADQ